MSAQTLSIAVLSGKGGVGKSNVTLNLALALQKMGARVLIVDGDLGLANVDVLMGFTPSKTLWDVVQGKASLEETMHQDDSGVNILPAASGTGTQADLDQQSCQQFVRMVRPLAEKHDFLLIDLGAGLSDTVRLLAKAASLQLVVTTPEPTALTDAYALIKVLHVTHSLSSFYVCVNNIFSDEEVALTRTRLLNACKKFLQFRPKLLGSIRHDDMLKDAVARRIPLLRLHPGSPAGVDITLIAQKIFSLRKKMIADGTISPCLSLRARQAAPAAGAAKAKAAAPKKTGTSPAKTAAKTTSTKAASRTTAAKSTPVRTAKKS